LNTPAKSTASASGRDYTIRKAVESAQDVSTAWNGEHLRQEIRLEWGAHVPGSGRDPQLSPTYGRT